MTLKQAIAELRFKDEQIAELVRQAGEQYRKIEELRQQIALFQRRMYGPRSEKYHPDQLFFDSVLRESQGAEPEEPEPVVQVKATVRRKARPHGRMAIPDHLERVDEVLDLPGEQKVDSVTGRPLVKIRHLRAADAGCPGGEVQGGQQRAGAGGGEEICGPPAAVPAAGDIPARGH